MKDWFYSLPIDRVSYEISVGSDGEVSFKAVSAYPEELGIIDDSWDMPDRYVSYSSHGSCREPVRVLRAIGEKISHWVEKARPEYFFFRAVDPKKLEVYRRMATRFSVSGEYECFVGYDGAVATVNFVRK